MARQKRKKSNPATVEKAQADTNIALFVCTECNGTGYRLSDRFAAFLKKNPRFADHGITDVPMPTPGALEIWCEDCKAVGMHRSGRFRLPEKHAIQLPRMVMNMKSENVYKVALMHAQSRVPPEIEEARDRIQEMIDLQEEVTESLCVTHSPRFRLHRLLHSLEMVGLVCMVGGKGVGPAPVNAHSNYIRVESDRDIREVA